MSSAGNADVYTNNMTLTTSQDNSDRPYAVYTPANLTAWGNAAGSGVIKSRVVNSINQSTGYIGGAVVTATDQADGTIYKGKYIDNTTGNISSTLTGTDPANGFYVFLNLPDGHTFNVTATVTGFSFNTKTFTVHANAVSESRIIGTGTSYTGKVYDYSQTTTGTPISGVAVTTIGLTPAITATTDSTGTFVLSAIPAGASFSIKMSLAQYADSYSNTFSQTGNQDNSDRPFSLWAPAAITGWGNSSGKGVIRSRVVSSTNQTTGYIGGVVVTATDITAGVPAGTTYPVQYIDGSTGNISSTLKSTDPTNGLYVVLNVPAGNTVNVTALPVAGYTFNTKTFTVQADSVSQSRIIGTLAFTTTMISGNSFTYQTMPTNQTGGGGGDSGSVTFAAGGALNATSATNGAMTGTWSVNGAGQLIITWTGSTNAGKVETITLTGITGATLTANDVTGGTVSGTSVLTLTAK